MYQKWKEQKKKEKTYCSEPGHFWMFHIKVLLKLGQLTEVPLLFTETLSWITKFLWRKKPEGRGREQPIIKKKSKLQMKFTSLVFSDLKRFQNYSSIKLLIYKQEDHPRKTPSCRGEGGGGGGKGAVTITWCYYPQTKVNTWCYPQTKVNLP